MKKYIIVLITLFTLTGCVNINNLNNTEVIDEIFKNPAMKATIAMPGYKIYLPKNMTINKDKENNNNIYSLSDKYYLYVDIISYYNKVNNEYKINTDKSAIYSNIVNYNNKKGYVLVTEYENKYFVEVMFNYGKIEVITEDYKTAIANSLIILRSIEFNDKIIESLIGNNILSYDEEEFNLLGPNSKTDTFLQYEQNDKYEDIDNELPDEDIIDIEEE